MSRHHPHPMQQLLEKKCKESEASDFTFYLGSGDGINLKQAVQYFRKKTFLNGGKVDDVSASSRSFDFEESVHVGGKSRMLRVQASSTNRGGTWSVTVRWDPPKVKAEPEAGAKSKVAPLPLEFDHECRWQPRSSYGLDDSGEHLDGNLFSISEVVDVLYQALFKCEGPVEKQGMLLIAGATGSAKSQIARGLAHAYLKGQLPKSGNKKARNLHVLTHEDPIEEFLFEKPQEDESLPPVPGHALEGTHVDYTPRQLRFDTSSLKETIEAALRQKPALLFVGEARSAEDLKLCMEFGGTGHFVIVTAHAGSLVESVEKLLQAASANSPGLRALWVPKVFGVVHLVRLSCYPPEMTVGPYQLAGKISGLVPTIYRRTPQGRQNLVADGLASLLPHCPAPGDIHLGTLGRQYFAERLLRRPVAPNPDGKDDLQQLELWQQLREWNLGPLAEGGNPADGPRRLIDVAYQGDLDGR